MRRLTVMPRRDAPARGKRRPAKTRVRRRRSRPWLRPLAVYGGSVLAVLLIAGWTTWAWTSGRIAAGLDAARLALVEVTARAGLTLEEVYVTGRAQTPRVAILEALGLRAGDPLVTLDPEAARRRLEALGWVRMAAVERRLPDTVFVRLHERVPLALWQRNGRLVVIDRTGVTIEGAAARGFASLPVIVGDDAPAHAVSLLGVMASEPLLRKRVKAAIRVGGRRWNLRLDNGIDVQLPAEGVAEAWRRLADYDRRHRLLARDISAVDLRLPDRLVVLGSPPTARTDGKGKNT